ncbi:bifunctional enoyl-CoA hydratase/phosphate acetyltransferase [Skermanella stibiiresistens SB22]|uniref:Bifunctional enoyl-CoA hydratase/phosphate acetyltransferase n=1 Tax=Skermanella stibiiresistens SB22 TaxID=1385369 RepID=W9H3N1_9PROT|nr:bifunctional enoyl-CoA hydratase/phosphate acetyltransferase [Skermanella stibiiresistens]EWY40805.1 bifunctional enoyl-CoA hydratase/phosphate acetyltransferase [Skermanella stibiiresistens SB22]
MDTFQSKISVPAAAGEVSDIVENVTYDEIAIGRSAALSRMLSLSDIELFARVSGDTNPAHLDTEYAAGTMFKGVIGHGIWSASIVSAVLGTSLPGPGTIYLSQDLKFRRPVRPGDMITATVTAKEKRDDKKIVVFGCEVTNQAGEVVLSGDATVIAPSHRISRPRVHLHEFRLFDHAGHEALLAKCQGLEPISAAVVFPTDEVSLRGAVEAAAAGLIKPLLVGPETVIRALAERHGLDLGAATIVPAENDIAAAIRAVALVRDGQAEALMKGNLHTDILLAEVVRRESGLRTGRRVSHVFVMQVPGRLSPLLVTDAAVLMYPTLDEKVDIAQNAIDLAHVLGIDVPRVAVLSAVETVSSKIPSTIDAAALTVMAARGQIRGAIVDGPLAFDNAVDPEAARVKGIKSEVAGRADILLVPNFEAGNMVAKELSKIAQADGAGIVMGARCPIILTSRSDDERTRVASCAVAVLVAHARKA